MEAARQIQMLYTAAEYVHGRERGYLWLAFPYLTTIQSRLHIRCIGHLPPLISN